MGGEVVAAGTPATIRIINASKADILDTYGFVDIFSSRCSSPTAARCRCARRPRASR